MTKDNVVQVADWNGQSGERWVAYQTRLDAMMAVFGHAAIEAAAPAKGDACWTSVAAQARRVWISLPASARMAMCSAWTSPNR
jgi:hypothetical protein